MGVSESNINILQTDFEQKKLLQRNTSHTMALYVSEKHSVTRGFGQKNSPPLQKSNGPLSHFSAG